MSCAARLDFVQSGFFAFFINFFQATTQKFGNRGHAHRSSDERGKQITRLFADAKGGAQERGPRLLRRDEAAA